MSRGGPLAGLRVVELAAIGPCPFAAMVLGDLGADVVRIERPGRSTDAVTGPPPHDLLNRSRAGFLEVDLKTESGRDRVLDIVETADVLIEGFRPGVLERIGFAPETLWSRNPSLVIGRMTGWGQDGPLAQAAGHDINYLALSGALHMIGRRGERPVPPINLVADFGGGGLLLALGVLSASWEASRSGQGQVVDAAMVEGAALLTTLFHGLMSVDRWVDTRGSNQLDSGAPFYDVYETSDGAHLAFGAIEPHFYAEFCALTGLDMPSERDRLDPALWDEQKDALATLFATRTRAEWVELLEGTDACVSPVMALGEAAQHPHLAARRSFVDVGGVVQPAPAPRFSRTPNPTPTDPDDRPDVESVLTRWASVTDGGASH